MGNKVIATTPYSELGQFASWFHQDCHLLFSAFEEGLEMYLSSLSRERKAALRRELRAFLKETDGLPDGSTGRLWRGKGAHNWPRNLKTRQVLQDVINSL